MLSSDQVRAYVAGLVVPQSQQLTMMQVASQDEQDALFVLKHMHEHQQRLVPIVEQLRKFTGKDIPIEFERHYRRGLAKPNGTISIDFATLRKPKSELAFTVAHEWAHIFLGHLTSSILEQQAECEADYWGAIFLGYFEYDLDELLKIKLLMPQMDIERGGQFDRACIIGQGYVDGHELRLKNHQIPGWPGFEVFRSQFQHAPWHVETEVTVIQSEEESKARKLFK
jgi:hypothetical protein